MLTEAARFPELALVASHDQNAAIRAFGRRFYKDQTPLEYLAEFLLACTSPKGNSPQTSATGFPALKASPREELGYYPESRLALKLFSFLPSSKLETRHPEHVKRFRRLVDDVGAAINPVDGGTPEAGVRILQQLFAGFVGVSGQRTWVTQTFIPASRHLLSREVDWRHTAAAGIGSWEETDEHFTTGSHNFMARGGEHLFLQLWHLFALGDLAQQAALAQGDHYGHLDLTALHARVEGGLQQLVDAIDEPLSRLGTVIEAAAVHAPEIKEKLERQKFGWVYKQTWQEALLFAWEIANICASSYDSLRKLRILQDLCCLHVLRSLCFQAARLVPRPDCPQGPFIGGYAWIATAPAAGLGTDLGKASHVSLREIESLLFQALRSPLLPAAPGGGVAGNPEKGDDHAFRLFRSLGKQVGLIVPRLGPGARFTLNGRLIETLVACLVEPGGRIQLDEFLWRAYAHFGIALGAPQIGVALETLSEELRVSPANDCGAWLEEELKRGGLLIPLSDAVSMVINPAEKHRP